MLKLNKLNKKTNFVLTLLSNFKFKQHLIHKANEYGCIVIILIEEYTSQCSPTCGNCSKKNTVEELKCVLIVDKHAIEI